MTQPLIASPTPSLALLAAPVLLALLAGCAALPTGPGPGAAAPVGAPTVAAAAPASGASAAASAAAAGRPGAAASAPTPNPLRPFAEVIKDAQRSEGLFTVWQKDDKVWLELKPSDFDQPMILSPKYKTGLGEGRVFGGLMGEEVAVEFRRIHNTVQLIARNTEFTAKAGTPTGRAVAAAYSDSLLAGVPVLSQPHPQSKAVLVEANAIFLSDMLGTGMLLQRSYRQGYSLDARNSAITTVRDTPELLVVESLMHFATANIALPQPGAPPGMPAPTFPKTVPDARSLFITLHYSLARLPATPMAARVSDPRIGYFTTNLTDFTDDLARTPRVRFVNRWRLEKKDPAATLSEPVKPITFWLDRSIPEKYRPTITAGVLEWNKAFERIGFKDAVRVELVPENADFDTLDFGRASIRWMTNVNPSFGAIGPSHVDPRSGEILDADIGIESLSSRNLRTARSQILSTLGLPSVDGPDRSLAGPLTRGGLGAAAFCDYADGAAEQVSYGLDVLEARGDIDPDSPEAQQFVLAYLKDVTMHEVGHTLGLRHNFRSSRIYTERQLSDPAFTQSHGITGSVMEYAPINLAAPGTPKEAQPSPFNTTLGPYDYWAIEYAYKPLPAGEEAGELSHIAARNAEPTLAYGTDEDNFLGVDPETLQFDLGADPLAFARKRIAIGRDLLQRQEQRPLKPDEDYAVLRRSVSYALRDMARAAGVLTRQIGGVRTLRDHVGSGRDPLMPVPAAEQREALDVLTAGFLSADSFKISPSLQRRLALDFGERTDAVFRGEPAPATDFSLASPVQELQRAVLGQLLSDAVASRLLDSEAKTEKGALQLSELYRRIDQSVWSELGGKGDIAPLRRELQREHVNKIAGLLVRPSALTRADARSLTRADAQVLLGRIQAASRRGGLSAEAQAHLQDCADSLREALAARLERAGA